MKFRPSEEVRQALADGSPVVALESSVVAQGLPPPHNLACAVACERAIRAAGAIPAAVAVIDGIIRLGLSNEEWGRLASGEPGLRKLSSRDLAFAVAQRSTGGTTVSATCEVAGWAGVQLFATGGIGGVHRHCEQQLDVSQDLWALSRFPVAVVCAGAKVVLDLPRTLEVLESLGVPVVGVATDRFPAFYSETSDLRLDVRVDDAAEAAALVSCRLRTLGQGGMLLALPPPSKSALPAAELERYIEVALAEAQTGGIRGKAVTPFLLERLAQATQGRSLTANLALLENNARFAAEVAVHLSQTS